MSRCMYCRQRKGKRACPALGGLICSQCCGEHRMVRITCPSDCVYLDSNSEYQHKRVGDRFAQERREFYKGLVELGGEKAAGLFNLIEVVTFSYYNTRRDAQDGEVIASLQSLRRTLSPLHIPSAPPPVFAEILKKEVFGPVLTLQPFESEEEGVALANGTDYGLDAIVYTGDRERAKRVSPKLVAGTVWVNCFFVRDLRAPFGGARNSGIGREGGRWSFDFYADVKNVCSAPWEGS